MARYNRYRPAASGQTAGVGDQKNGRGKAVFVLRVAMSVLDFSKNLISLPPAS